MNLNLYRKRLTSYGETAQDRLDYRNKQLFKKSLQDAFNSEDVVLRGETHKAIMLNDKLTLDIDQKWFDMEHEAGLKVGDVVQVLRNDTYWIMVQEDLNNRSFTKCVGSRAQYNVSWRDDNDEIQTSWATVRGPTETSIKTESRKHLLFDQGNEKLSLFMPSGETTRTLRRYGHLMVDGNTWEIASTDHYTTPGIMEVALVEAQNNPYTDNEDLGIARDSEFVFSNLFEKDLSFVVNQPLSLNPSLTKDGSDITITKADDFIFSTNAEKFNYDEIHQTVTFYEPGSYEVNLGYPKIGFSKSYVIMVSAVAESEDEYYVIEGTTKIIPLNNDLQSYDIEYYINGVETELPAPGVWRYDKKYVTNVKSHIQYIDIEFNGTPGTMALEYVVDGTVVAKMDISILTIFG